MIGHKQPVKMDNWPFTPFTRENWKRIAVARFMGEQVISVRYAYFDEADMQNNLTYLEVNLRGA